MSSEDDPEIVLDLPDVLDDMRSQIHLLCAADIKLLENQVVNPRGAKVTPFAAARKGEDTG